MRSSIICALFVVIRIATQASSTAEPLRIFDQKFSGLKPLDVSSRIVNGFRVGRNELPYQLSLQQGGHHYCGAAILNKNYAITAAHCVAGSFPSSITTVAGKIKLNEFSKFQVTSHIRKIYIHRGYDVYSNTHDIAILKFRKSLEFNEAIMPVTLPPMGYKLDKTAQLTVSGWGLSSMNDDQILPQLRKAILPIISTEECNRAYEGLIQNGMICAGYLGQGGQDACQGDSGGPMVLRSGNNAPNILVGIVSWGRGCAFEGYPGVYTNVPMHVRWINKVMGLKKNSTVG